MPNRRIHKIFTSVFSKLMLIILLTGLGINLALIMLLGAFRHHIAGSYQPHLTRYAGYLIRELGNPPDLQRARRIASETNMVILYNGPALSWSTADTPLDVSIQRFRRRYQNDKVEISSYHGIYRVVVRTDDGRLTFLLPHQADAENRLRILSIGLVVYVTLLMTGAYLVIRRILKPLRWLRQGVGEVARGELSHQVPAGRSDELGELSRAFNTMTDRIRRLVTAKERLLLDVSHELRTPITRMKVALAMMAQSPGKQSIEEDLKEMEQKIAELLDTARAVNIKADLDLRVTDVMSLLKEAAEAFKGIAPGIRIQDEIAVVRLPLDGPRMGQAIKNIIDNALKFSTREGRPVEAWLKVQDQRVVIGVRDRGSGIPETDLDFVFEPFYRVDRSRTPRTGGYGLGLSLAKTIVEAHGGRIAISSATDQGTTVCIFLPLQIQD